MIARIMGEGQFRLDDDLQKRLNELDDEAVAALDRDDEVALDRCLDQMADLVRTEGTPLSEEELHPSDIVIPPSDLTLEETRALFSDDGLIPDIPT